MITRNLFLYLCVGITMLQNIQPALADTKGDVLAAHYFNLKKADTTVGKNLLVLIDSKGNKRVKNLVRYSRQTKGGQASYIEFLEPADVRGTKFLTTPHKNKDDEQRLFLPALGKVRRIASSDKGASFMGTDLTYYDLEDKNIEDFTFRDLGEDVVNNVSVFVLEMIPLNENAPYSKMVVFMDQHSYFPIKTACYDKDNVLIKSLINLRTETIDNIIIATRIVVDNYKDKQKTLLQINNLQINKEIPNMYFSIQNLSK